jgi:hypothetical protein
MTFCLWLTIWRHFGVAFFVRPQFFADKDVEHILGEDIQRSKLNDDTLGRVLDRLSKVGSNTHKR